MGKWTLSWPHSHWLIQSCVSKTCFPIGWRIDAYFYASWRWGWWTRGWCVSLPGCHWKLHFLRALALHTGIVFFDLSHVHFQRGPSGPAGSSLQTDRWLQRGQPPPEGEPGSWRWEAPAAHRLVEPVLSGQRRPVPAGWPLPLRWCHHANSR